MNFFVLVIGLYLLISYVLIKLLGLISDVYKKRLVIGFYWCLNFFVLSGLFFLRFREIDNISSAVGKLFFTYISLQFMALLLSPLALLIEKILSINSNNTFDDTKRNLLANCQVKCDTSCKKTSIADFQPRHFRGLELIRNRLCISSISFTRERSVFLG